MGKDGEFTDLQLFLSLMIGLLQMNERRFLSLVRVLQYTDIQSLLYGSAITPTRRTKNVRQYLQYHMKPTQRAMKTSAPITRPGLWANVTREGLTMSQLAVSTLARRLMYTAIDKHTPSRRGCC